MKPWIPALLMGTTGALAVASPTPQRKQTHMFDIECFKTCRTRLTFHLPPAQPDGGPASLFDIESVSTVGCYSDKCDFMARPTGDGGSIVLPAVPRDPETLVVTDEESPKVNRTGICSIGNSDISFQSIRSFSINPRRGITVSSDVKWKESAS
ncbi:hypothetical protein BKA67DRAFT_537984 [Truncatella angustata]|uniref:Uncharacterized protein n=1 Tax=Truncatella angustata TaxID=152316 RepID=A0A9P8UH93_9PEZI|nr:uncharacterized protein BKA67DRAFT_537984 [Truncatella angustata]KAH6652151.1 hypothetical protein BKA67DRAFT_537984 [Truncatella angustata]